MGAGELLIIAVIGLLVLGPERLPVAIRTVSRWIRSAKQMAGAVSAEMTHELKVNELHNNLKKAEEQGFENLSPEVAASVKELQDAAASVRGSVQESVEQLNQPVSADSNQPTVQDGQATQTQPGKDTNHS